MATIQCKTLKKFLREVGAIDSTRKDKAPRCRTERIYRGRYDDGKAYYEYGNATAMIAPLSEEQEQRLRDKSKWLKIRKHCVGTGVEFWAVEF